MFHLVVTVMAILYQANNIGIDVGLHYIYLSCLHVV